jgi:hypothetical protein
MEHAANGDAKTALPGADIIIRHLVKIADRLSGPYQVRVVTSGLPYLHVVSQIDPELYEDVLCDFSIDPPGYLTAFGHRLGNAGDPGAATATLAHLFQAADTQGY